MSSSTPAAAAAESCNVQRISICYCCCLCVAPGSLELNCCLRLLLLLLLPVPLNLATFSYCRQPWKSPLAPALPPLLPSFCTGAFSATAPAARWNRQQVFGAWPLGSSTHSCCRWLLLLLLTAALILASATAASCDCRCQCPPSRASARVGRHWYLQPHSC